jgi:hypothetical protein
VPYLCLLLQTLAYNAGMFSRAQALRREGTAPAAMGVSDDLPTRMAYQQLHILAGMAGKVGPLLGVGAGGTGCLLGGGGALPDRQPSVTTNPVLLVLFVHTTFQGPLSSRQ